MTKIQLHTRLKTPLQGHLINGNSALFTPSVLVHGGVKMIRRIEMGTIMRTQLNKFDGPALAVG